MLRRGRIRAKRLLVLTVTIASFGALAPAANAAVRFASPDGSGAAPCAESAPCNINTAISGAADGDEVVLASGTYDSAHGVPVQGIDVGNTQDNLLIHGRPGQPRPVISFSDGAEPAVEVLGTGTTIRDAKIEALAANEIGLYAPGGGTFERMQILASGNGGVGALLFGASGLRSSIVRAPGTSATAGRGSHGSDPQLVGDPPYAAASGSKGLEVTCTSTPASPIGLDTILVGGSFDYQVHGSCASSLELSYSNYDASHVQVTGTGATFTDGGHNQTAQAPAFVDASSGGINLHEAAGSPTIDAGAASSAPLDVDSETRSGVTDIGADEFQVDGPVRYAAPDAVALGACGTPANACRLQRAIEGADDDDHEVVLAPGQYGGDGPIVATRPLDIHGPAGGPRPVVSDDNSVFVLSLSGGGTSQLRGVDVVQDGDGIGVQVQGAGTIDRVFSSSAGAGGLPIQLLGGGVVTNSVAWARGASSSAIFAGLGASGTIALRNVTAVSAAADAGSFGIDFHTGGDATMTLRNVIAQGGGTDIRAIGENPGDVATVDVANSNYETTITTGVGGTGLIVDSGGNQTANPLFADAAAGDFHQLAGSPTVDAGVTAPANGALDLDGDPRALGAQTDIGADEFLPKPTVVTGAASGIDAGGATVSGTVDPEVQATSWYFEYGTTAGYGSQTATAAAGSGTDPVAVQQSLAGLAPATTYHYRLVGTNGSGTTTGDDATFTTMPGPDLVAPL